MSLINDALKRAKETHPGNAPAAATAPMQPANQQPGFVGLPVYFVPVLLATVCGAGLFLWNGWETKRNQIVAHTPLVVQARQGEADPEPETLALTDPDGPGIPQGRNFSLDDDTPRAARLSAGTEPETSPMPPSLRDESLKPTGPVFKLQGIFYRSVNPSAVINAKTVFVGDRVANARVKSIGRDTVTLDYQGETKVLTFQ